VRRFKIAYGSWWWVLAAIGCGPWFTWVDLDAGEVRVRMGWSFRARGPRSSLLRAGPAPDWRWAIGAHTNFRGAWLVNGTTTRIVAVDLSPPAPGRCIGWPIHVKRLGLSLEDGAGFLRALGFGGAGP
jgi:hypothetical protein